MKRSMQVTVVFPQTFEFEYDDIVSVDIIKERIKDRGAYLMESSGSEPIITYCDVPRFVEESSFSDKIKVKGNARVDGKTSIDNKGRVFFRIGEYEMIDFGVEWNGHISKVSNEGTHYSHFAHGFGNNPRSAFRDLIDTIAEAGFGFNKERADVEEYLGFPRRDLYRISLMKRVLSDFGIAAFPVEPATSQSEGACYHLAMRFNEI